jgi:uncharacterized protein (TIGR02246 family)
MKHIKTYNKVNEGRLQDKVWDEVSGLSINAYANLQHEFAISDDANEMQEFIENLSDRDAKKLLDQLKKKMYEGKLNEASVPTKFDKAVFKVPPHKMTRDWVLKVAKKFGVEPKYAIAWVNKVGRLNLAEGKLNELDADKSKEYIKKAIDTINDAMFNFRHSYPLKMIAAKDRKLKDQLDSMHNAIFDIEKSLKDKGLFEGKLNEASERFLKSAGEILANQMQGKSAGYDTLMNRLNSMPLAKKLKDDDLEKVVEYAMKEMGLKEGKLTEGKVSKKDKKIIEDLLNDPNAKLSTIEKGIIKKLISEGKLTEGTYIDLRIVNENVTDEIEGALSHWLNTLADGDAVQMSDLYLDNGILLGTVAPEILQGRLQIQEYFEMFLGKNPIGSIDTFILQNFGDICVADGTYTFELDGEGGRQSVAARYTYVWKKENDKWMIATHHSSVNPK